MVKGAKKIQGQHVQTNAFVANTIEPARKFVNDSARLLKKCSKPDMKGAVTCFGIGITSWLDSPFLRVQGYCASHGYRVFSDGVHWILRQIDPHSNQVTCFHFCSSRFDAFFVSNIIVGA